MELGLALWQGEYRGALRQWLRWYDAQGSWIPTEAERERQQKELAQQEVEQERQQRELAERQAEELAQHLRELGVEL